MSAAGRTAQLPLCALHQRCAVVVVERSFFGLPACLYIAMCWLVIAHHRPAKDVADCSSVFVDSVSKYM